MKRVRLGKIYAHSLTSEQAIDEVAELVSTGRGGYILTPNVDHVVQAEHSEALRLAYEDASLSLVDGQTLVWLAGCSVPTVVTRPCASTAPVAM